MTTLNKLLRIKIKKDNKEYISIKVPLFCAKSLKTIIPSNVIYEIQTRNINLTEIQKKLEQTNYAEQTVFELDYDNKNIKVYIK